MAGTPRKFDWTYGHVQRETGTDSFHVEREVVFTALTKEYHLRFRLPKYIAEALSEGEREFIRVQCNDLFGRMLFVAKISGERNAEQICLEEALRTYIENVYRSFVQIQIRHGNKKWLVPKSMQARVFEEN